MMLYDTILRLITKLTLPFILLFALYIQLHGELSPGGGFQAGVILASVVILYAMIFGVTYTMRLLPLGMVRFLAIFGVLIYSATGFVCMLKGGNYLDYSVLLADKVEGQKLGIAIVELGIGMSVFAAILLMYFTLVDKAVK